MDLLTALSLAGTVVQFVDFGSKLLSQGYELYRSTGGQLSVDEEVDLITANLLGLVSKMRRANILGAQRKYTSVPRYDYNAQSVNFENICAEAVKIAEAILVKIEMLKIDDTKSRKLETLKKVWKRLWSQSEIDSLLRRLLRLKDVINTEVLAVILQNTNELNVRTLAHFDSLDQQAQRILTSLLESNQATTREIMTALTQLMNRLETFNLESHRRNREVIIQWRPVALRAKDPASQLMDDEEVNAGFLDVHYKEEKIHRAYVQKKILDNLFYRMMPKRYESVIDAHPTTFEWAFHDSTTEGGHWASLSSWLKTGNGLYWISGKPGSGKSTLMKHIYDDNRTQLYLRNWARMGEATSVPLVIATFFFWNSGTLEQRSQAGMIRALLFQVLEQKPELIPVVFPSLWARQYRKWLGDGPSVCSEPWTLRPLLEAFKRLVAQMEFNMKLFFLIDGLDEFDGDYEVLIGLFDDILMSSDRNPNYHIKFCVSSRPWAIFKDTFSSYPTLYLQDLTLNDITKFVEDKLHAHTAFDRLTAQEPETACQMIQEIVNKAEGVFLWVYIVVKDLLRGIRNHDSLEDLWRRIRALPKELEPLYRHIVSQIEPTYLLWASKSFQLVRAAYEITIPASFTLKEGDTKKGLISLAELSFALNESLTNDVVEKMSQQELEKMCRETEYHITARSACLLEVTKNKETNVSDYMVQYLHRTAKNFLEQPELWKEVLNHTHHILFDPFWFMMRCKSFMLIWHSRDINPDPWERQIIHDTAMTVLAFASRADAHYASHVHQVKILDLVEKLTTTHDINLDRLHSCFDKTAIPKGFRSSLVACSLALNLSGYLAEKLRNLDPLLAKSTSTYMLHSQMNSTDDYHNFIGGSPHMAFAMASVLTAYGADVNYRGDDGHFSTSTWEYFLKQYLENMDRSEDRNPDFARLMTLFLTSGADPRVSLHHNGRSFTLKDFSTYIGQWYSHEAASVQHEIIKALESSSPAPDREQGKANADTFAATIESYHQSATRIARSPKWAHASPSSIYNPPRIHSANAKSEKRNWWTRYFTTVTPHTCKTMHDDSTMQSSSSKCPSLLVAHGVIQKPSPALTRGAPRRRLPIAKDSMPEGLGKGQKGEGS